MSSAPMDFLESCTLVHRASGSASDRRGSWPSSAMRDSYRSIPPCFTVMALRWAQRLKLGLSRRSRVVSLVSGALERSKSPKAPAICHRPIHKPTPTTRSQSDTVLKLQSTTLPRNECSRQLFVIPVRPMGGRSRRAACRVLRSARVVPR